MILSKKAFTLIELLVVIGTISILAAGVIVAINPGHQFAQARDATRESHIRVLHSSLVSYQISNQGSLNGLSLPTEPTEICNTNLENPNCDNLVDLSAIVSDGHINNLPVDPQGSISDSGDGTGYFVAEGSIVLIAENAETRFIGIKGAESEEIKSFTFNNLSTGREGDLQEWTVPSSGTYRITAYGAEGGGKAGEMGLGAKISGEFNLSKDQIIKILVGQKGTEGSLGGEGGGGGGSFVTFPDNTPLIIAGGGGGQGYSEGSEDDYDDDGVNASLGEVGLDGKDWASIESGGMGGENGEGGQGATQGYGGGGGGGLLTDGGDGGMGQGGLSFLNGAYGGLGEADSGDGGYGGGGGNGYWGGGAGGGYSGGGGGADYSGGGGGGSYNDGLNKINQAGVAEGQGKIIIEFISS